MAQNSILDRYSIQHRHVNLSILAVGHSFRGIGGLPKTLRLQVDYGVFFSPASVTELETIVKDVSFASDRDELLARARDVFKKKYNFIVFQPSAPLSRRLLVNFKTPLMKTRNLEDGPEPEKKRQRN
jgi:hypothetical protein